MATDISTQFVREAPEIEAQKVALMRSALASVNAANAAADQGRYLTPSYQIAGFSPDQTRAMEAARTGIGAYQPYMSAATQQAAAARGSLGGVETGQSNIAQGIGALGGAYQGYNPQMAMNFMNPYQQSVIDESVRQINRQGDIARQNLQAQAVRAGAFGGSREGIQRAELERALSEQRNAAILGGLQQGYGAAQQQAQQAFEQQQGRQLAAGQGIAAAGTQYGQLAGQLASQQGGLAGLFANLGAQQSGLGQQDVNFLYNIGAQQQRQNQAVLDAQRQNQLQQNMQPYQQMAFLSDIYKGAPSTQMAMTQQTQAAASPFQQIAGLTIAGTTAAAAANKAGLL